jgi:hypothetical protein
MKNLPQQVAIVVVGLIISALAWIPIAVGHDPKPKAGQEPHETHDKAHDGHKHGDRHNHATVPRLHWLADKRSMAPDAPFARQASVLR